MTAAAHRVQRGPGHDAPGGSDPLAPVRRALLSDAEAEAQRVLAAAQAAADAAIADAHAEVEAAVEQARRRAAASARAHAASALRMARRRAHAEVLAARAALRADLADRARVAVEQLADDPRYPALLEHVERLALAQLGDAAIVTREPPPVGGVVATSGSRQVGYRLAELAERALGAIADEVVP